MHKSSTLKCRNLMKAKKAHIRLVDNATICYVDTAVSNASFSRYGHESLAEVAAHSAKVEHFTLLIFNLSSIRIEISWIEKDKRERERERERRAKVTSSS